MCIELKLPIPPSINDYYGTRKTGFAKYIKPKGVVFRWQVKAEWLKSKQKQAQGLLKIKILYVFNNKRFNDVDNRLKPLFDALQIAGVFPDDKNFIEENSAKIYEKCDESYVLIKLWDNQESINKDWFYAD